MSLWPRLAGCELEARGGHLQPRFRQRFGLQSNERRQRPGYLAVSSRSLLGPRLQRATASQINGYVTTSNIQGSRSSLERRRWCFPVKDAYPGGVHIHYTIAQAVLRPSFPSPPPEEGVSPATSCDGGAAREESAAQKRRTVSLALGRASTAIEETLPAEQGPRVSTRRVIPTAHRAGGPVGLRPRTRRSTSRSEPTLRRETAQRKGSRGAPVWEASLSHGFFRMCRPVQPCVLSVWVQMGFAQVLASPRCIPPCFWRSAWRF